MTVGQIFGWALVGGMFGALIASVSDGRIARAVRVRRARRAELRRLAGIDTRPRQINTVRRDPSPRPRRKAAA